MSELVACKCTNCGFVNYPKHDRCLNCRAREFEEITPSGEATLITYSEVCTLPWGIDERCRMLGIVQFENKVKAMGRLRVDKPRLGMRLKPSWEPVRVIGGEEVLGLTLRRAK
ncbi:MAG: hypothetical protein JSW37_08365 [Anaerolineales bacterium]|jgi:uncharacterized OB-fold protein|nr:MAG: hypothetical protein JSW37_08365 [Anaerolineales bacterium]